MCFSTHYNIHVFIVILVQFHLNITTKQLVKLKKKQKNDVPLPPKKGGKKDTGYFDGNEAIE